MIKRLRLSPFLRDIVLTTVTSMATILSIIIVMRLLARGLGPEGFGVYSLARRVVSTISPFSTLTMGVAVARYIGLSKDKSSQYGYLLGGLALGVPLGLIILIAGLLGSNRLADFVPLA